MTSPYPKMGAKMQCTRQDKLRDAWEYDRRAMSPFAKLL